MGDNNLKDVVDDAGDGAQTSKAQEIVYCEICTFPPEVLILHFILTISTVNSVDP
jgi:hypothetical protein